MAAGVLITTTRLGVVTITDGVGPGTRGRGGFSGSQVHNLFLKQTWRKEKGGPVLSDPATPDGRVVWI